MRLPRRRKLWLGVLLLAVLTCAWLFMPRSRITQQNFDRIYRGMTLEEVQAILGDGKRDCSLTDSEVGRVEFWDWDSAQVHVDAYFQENKLLGKEIRFRTAWETLTWYGNTVSTKLGVTFGERQFVIQHGKGDPAKLSRMLDEQIEKDLEKQFGPKDSD